MIGLEYVLVLFGAFGDKLSKMNWAKRLLPKFKVDGYPKGWAFGIEFTSPRGKSGLGLGVGLGKVDLWAGWPRHEENLHYDGCRHD